MVKKTSCRMGFQSGIQAGTRQAFDREGLAESKNLSWMSKHKVIPTELEKI